MGDEGLTGVSMPWEEPFLVRVERTMFHPWIAVLVCVVSAVDAGNHVVDAARRHIRALTYPEESEMGLFFALAIPLDDPRKSISVAFFFEANYELPSNVTEWHLEGRRRGRRSIDRRTIYNLLEAKFESIGFPGRQCLLRSICETAHYPVHLRNGVLGDIMRIVFTPSSSADEGLPLEYTLAERVDSTEGCFATYPLCPFGIYDYITEVHE
ncbi:uncharacterized protein LOC105701921 [Orussus abietinus]|uniref:uncharacterized protein LOC105701921 n=1 Tax=Orussus abietinus TaxID=222816 RepID=UPI0006258D38|nr:uncharacterized protein LOC105701921 [Orussus abietinus]